jgi:hypothetical protein
VGFKLYCILVQLHILNSVLLRILFDPEVLQEVVNALSWDQLRLDEVKLDEYR